MSYILNDRIEISTTIKMGCGITHTDQVKRWQSFILKKTRTSRVKLLFIIVIIETHYTDQEIRNIQSKEAEYLKFCESMEKRVVSRERLNNRKTEREIVNKLLTHLL